MLTWPTKDPKMTLIPLSFIQGGEITLNFLGVADQMLWALPPNLGCFLPTTLSPSLILLILFRDHVFRVYLMHLDHHHHHLLLLKFNLLLVTLTLIKLRGDLIINMEPLLHSLSLNS